MFSFTPSDCLIRSYRIGKVGYSQRKVRQNGNVSWIGLDSVDCWWYDFECGVVVVFRIKEGARDGRIYQLGIILCGYYCW
jgi:hypothetical protein